MVFTLNRISFWKADKELQSAAKMNNIQAERAKLQKLEKVIGRHTIEIQKYKKLGSQLNNTAMINKLKMPQEKLSGGENLKKNNSQQVLVTKTSAITRAIITLRFNTQTQKGMVILKDF